MNKISHQNKTTKKSNILSYLNLCMQTMFWRYQLTEVTMLQISTNTPPEYIILIGPVLSCSIPLMLRFKQHVKFSVDDMTCIGCTCELELSIFGVDSLITHPGAGLRLELEIEMNIFPFLASVDAIYLLLLKYFIPVLQCVHQRKLIV